MEEIVIKICNGTENDTKDVLKKMCDKILSNNKRNDENDKKNKENKDKDGYVKIEPISNYKYSKLLSFLHYFSLYSDTQKSKLIYDYIHNTYFAPFKGTITLTFGDVAESHVGMQKIGEMSEHGFSLTDIQRAERFFKKKGCETRIVHLNKYLPNEAKDEEEKQFLEIAKKDKEFQAYVLIIRNGLNVLENKELTKELATEMLVYDWDKKMYNTKKKEEQNKNARHNLNFDDKSQISNFNEGKGTTVAWEDARVLKSVRSKLIHIFGKNAEGLKCEGNKYYDPTGTGIGYHGDSERRKVIGVRLGKKMNLHYMWYFNDRPRGYNISFQLNPGDIYCMSEKSVGTDWRPVSKKGWTKKRYTLRHAAGVSKYTTDTPTIKLDKKETIDEITLWNIQFKQKKTTVWKKMYN